MKDYKHIKSDLAFNLLLAEHERKARKAITKGRTAELIAQGVDPEVAKVMAKVGL